MNETFNKKVNLEVISLPLLFDYWSRFFGEFWDPWSAEEQQSLESSIKNRIDSISHLEDDWDDDGAVAISPETLNKTNKFLQSAISIIRCEHNSILSIPDISLCHNGSVDIHWDGKTKSVLYDLFYQLLVNIRPDGTASFFGEISNGLSMKGSFVVSFYVQKV